MNSKDKGKKNLSQELIKIRILAYLYRTGDYGANQNTIIHRSQIRSQDFTRFRNFLEDLVKLKFIEKHEEETAGEKQRIKYIILEKGKKLVEDYRNSNFPELFGHPIDDEY